MTNQPLTNGLTGDLTGNLTRAALFTAAALVLLSPASALLGYSMAVKTLFAVFGVIYGGSLLAAEGGKRLWTLYGIGASAIAAAALGASLHHVVAIVCAAVWVLRIILVRPSLTGAVSEGAVALLAAALFFSSLQTSFALAVWGFFLGQAAAALLPRRSSKKDARRCVNVRRDRFQLAHKSAQAALRELSTQAALR